ncbi:RNA polymerase II degradation factor 1-like isoform X2 [Choloepus didactylus]|uniref:RNA polymerase II degradation factor 1-like isoform X2 n=1 Tax=Choloepus didactylus TaxID=27675 RepID=UPI0018A09ADD|nr:RNA polymerase II degradation factor 1-like isoform X2 [Choloepus didactylus]
MSHLKPSQLCEVEGQDKVSAEKCAGQDCSTFTPLHAFPRPKENEQIPAFNHPYSKYLCSIYHVLDTLLCPRRSVVNKGVSVIQGRDCGLHPGGVAAPGPCPEDPVQGCDAGELQPLHLSGLKNWTQARKEAMASWGQSQGPRQEEPVLESRDDQPAAPCPGQESSPGNPGVRSMNMALTPSVMPRANLGPPLALRSSPSSSGGLTTQLQPPTTPSPSAFSPGERSGEWGNWEQNSIPLRSLADSYRGDIGLSQQLDRRLLQQLLRECPEWEQLLNPTLKTLLQSFLKSQHPRNPQEILLSLRDPQSEMRKLLHWLLGQFPYWPILLDQSLRRILQQYVLSREQQPGQGGQQEQTLQACLPRSHQWQQPTLGGQQSQPLQVCLPSFQCLQQPAQGRQQAAQGGQQPQMLQAYLPMFQCLQQPAQGRQQGQTLQAYLPTFQYLQQPAQGGQQPQTLQVYLPMFQCLQQPTQGGQQVQTLQAYLPTFQYPQQYAQGGQQAQTLQACLPMFQYPQQPAQGAQQAQMLQAYMPTFQYVQRPQVPRPGMRGQQGQMLQAYLPSYQQWQQQPELEGQQPRMLQAYLPTFQYPQQLSSADQQPRRLQTHHPPHQGSDG